MICASSLTNALDWDRAEASAATGPAVVQVSFQGSACISKILAFRGVSRWEISKDLGCYCASLPQLLSDCVFQIGRCHAMGSGGGNG